MSMLIFNKHKPASYLNLNDTFEIKFGVKKNAFRIYNFFNHSKRLIRSLILLHFYIYTLYPFCPILFRSTARFHIKLDSTLLVIINSDCYNNYYRFN